MTENYINECTQVYESFIVDRFGDVWEISQLNYYNSSSLDQQFTVKKLEGICSITSIVKHSNSEYLFIKEDNTVWLLQIGSTQRSFTYTHLNNYCKIIKFPKESTIVSYYGLKKDGTVWSIYGSYKESQVEGFEDIKDFAVMDHNGLILTGNTIMALKTDGSIWFRDTIQGKAWKCNQIDNVTSMRANNVVKDGIVYYLGYRYQGRDKSYVIYNCFEEEKDRYYITPSGKITRSNPYVKNQRFTSNLKEYFEPNAYVFNDNSLWYHPSGYTLGEEQNGTIDLVCLFKESVSPDLLLGARDCPITGEISSIPVSFSGRLEAITEYKWYALRCIEADSYEITIQTNDPSCIQIDEYWQTTDNNNKLRWNRNSIYGAKGYLSLKANDTLYIRVSANMAKEFHPTDFSVTIEIRKFTGKEKLTCTTIFNQLLKEDGSAMVWNANTTLTHFSSVARIRDIFSEHLLRDNGTAIRGLHVLKANGRNINPLTIPNIMQIAGGYALTSDGHVYFIIRQWLVTNGINVKAISARNPGNNEIILLKHDGSTWYYNSYTSSGIEVTQHENIKEISGFFALKEDGTVWCPDFLQKNISGSNVVASCWMQIEGLDNIKTMDHGLFLDHNGEVWQCTTGAAWSALSQIKKIAISDVKMIASCYSHSLAMRQDGTIWGWGKNTFCTDMPKVPSFDHPVRCMGATGPADDYPADFSKLPVILLPQDETPMTIDGTINYLEDNDSFAIKSVLDSTYKVEFTCDSPYVKVQLYKGNKSISDNLPITSIFYDNDVLYIRVYHLANESFSPTSYSLQLTRIVNSTEDITQLAITGGHTYRIPLLGKSLPGIDGILRERLHVIYDPTKLQLIQHNAPHPQLPDVQLPYLQILKQESGKVVMRKNKSINSGYVWTGHVSFMEFKALSSGTTEIKTISEF